MKQLTVFRILSFILVPIAPLFGIMALLMLLGSGGDPLRLLFAFVLATITIYTFTSLNFLVKGIDTGRRLKPSLRDWIRVNAYAAGAFSVYILMNVISIALVSEADLREMVNKFMATQPEIPSMLNADLMITAMKIVAWFMGFVGIVLLIHIRINFRLMKLHRQLFQEPEA